MIERKENILTYTTSWAVCSLREHSEVLWEKKEKWKRCISVCHWNYWCGKSNYSHCLAVTILSRLKDQNKLFHDLTASPTVRVRIMKQNFKVRIWILTEPELEMFNKRNILLTETLFCFSESLHLPHDLYNLLYLWQQELLKSDRVEC